MFQDVDGYLREQCIFPGINFTGCNGSITAWTIGVRWITGDGDGQPHDHFPYLQTWRNTGTDTYELVNSIELSVPGERSEGRYMFSDTIDPPLPFQDGDILGVFQSRGFFSQFRLHGLPGGSSSLSYHIGTNQEVEPPFDTITITDNGVASENSLPLVSVAISEFFFAQFQNRIE